MTLQIEEAIELLKENRLPLKIQEQRTDEKLIARYEDKLGIKFSADFKKLYQSIGYTLCNGKDILQLTELKDDSRDLAEHYELLHSQNGTKNLLPFCEDNSDYYCLNEKGEVVFWSHNGTTDEKWPDLATWIKEVWVEGG